MHAIIASLGTDGDVLPYLGIGAELRARGHRVTFLAAEIYGDLIAAHGLEFQQLVSAEFMRTLLGNADFWHPIKTARHTTRLSLSLVEPQYRLFNSIAAAASEPMFITNPAILWAGIVSEARHCPICNVVLQPWFIHSAIAPALMPVAGVPRWAPRFMHSLFYRAIELAADTMFGPTLNRVRRSAGLKPMRRILHNWFARDLVIGMFPEWYGAPQKDWPPQMKLAGFPRFDGVIDRTPPPGLMEFLKSPKPTALFTFGSGMMHAEKLFELAVRVCDSLNWQAILVSRHSKPASLPSNIYHADFIPFREIFPRCAAVIHHGGIGTTAEALAAGTPQLILPLGFDQLDNGDRVKSLGVGLHTPPKHRLLASGAQLRESDVAEIAQALKTLVQPDFRERCRAFSKRLQNNESVKIAATWIEESFKRQAAGRSLRG